VHIEFWWRSFKERDNLRDLGVEGRTILKRISINWIRMGVDSIHMARDTKKLWPFVKSGMQLRGP
jgi:hypothetical protein